MKHYFTAIAMAVQLSYCLIGCAGNDQGVSIPAGPDSVATTATPAPAYGSNNGKYLTVSNIKVYYEEYGKGTPLLLLHGGLSTIKGLAPIIPGLAAHYRVIAIDAPGQGRSEQMEVLSFKGMAAIYAQMIDALQLDSAYVYGFSVGGITALHLAASNPAKVKRTIVHSAVNHLDGYNELFYNSHEMTVADMERDGQWWIQSHIKNNPQPDKWKKFINDLRQMWIPHEFVDDATLKSIRTPVMIVQGDGDMIKLENAVKLKTLIPGSQLCILPNATHFVLNENPDLLKEALITYLQNKPKNKFELSN